MDKMRIEKRMGDSEEEGEIWTQQKRTLIDGVAERLLNGDLDSKIQAAIDIRNILRNSSVKTRSKFTAATAVIQPLVSLLLSPNQHAAEVSLLALLTLAARNERFVHFPPFVFAFLFFPSPNGVLGIFSSSCWNWWEGDSF